MSGVVCAPGVINATVACTRVWRHHHRAYGSGPGRDESGRAPPPTSAAGDARSRCQTRPVRPHFSPHRTGSWPERHTQSLKSAAEAEVAAAPRRLGAWHWAWHWPSAAAHTSRELVASTKQAVNAYGHAGGSWLPSVSAAAAAGSSSHWRRPSWWPTTMARRAARGALSPIWGHRVWLGGVISLGASPTARDRLTLEVRHRAWARQRWARRWRW